MNCFRVKSILELLRKSLIRYNLLVKRLRVLHVCSRARVRYESSVQSSIYLKVKRQHSRNTVKVGISFRLEFKKEFLTLKFSHLSLTAKSTQSILKRNEQEEFLTILKRTMNLTKSLSKQ